MAEGTLNKTLQGHTSEVNSVAFSPDSKLIASASDDKTVRVWNMPNGDLNAELKGHEGAVWSVAFSPDGKSIVAGFDSTVRIWSVATKQQVQTLTGHSNSVYSVAWSPNGKLIASGSRDKTVILWDAVSGSVKNKLTGHINYVYSVSFSQNGNKLASAGSFDNTAIIWDVHSGAALIKLAHPNRVNSACFSHDDQFVVTGCHDNIVRMFNANTGREEKRFQGHINTVYSVACSFDGSVIASGSYDKSARLWDVASTKQLQQLGGHTNNVRSVAFSRDGKFIASGSSDNTVRLWNTPSSLQHEILPRPVSPTTDYNLGEETLIPSFTIIAKTEAIAATTKQNAAEIEKQKKQQEIEKQQKVAELEKQKKELLAKQQEIEKQQQKIAAELEKQKQQAMKEQELQAKQQEIESLKMEFERQKAEQLKREQEIADRERKQREELEKQKKQEEEEEAKKIKVNLDPSEVVEWSVDDVCTFLKQAKLDDDVIAIFRKERIRGAVLSDYNNHEELNAIGITARGDRTQVIKAIQKIVAPVASATTSTPPTSSVGNSFIIQRHEIKIHDIALGSGHFGKVMLADCRGMPVALKQTKVSDADKYKEFVNEALTMKQVPHHEFVVNCVGLCMTDNEAYVVLELCNGSLLERLRDTSQPPLGPKQRLEILHRIAQGMDHLCQNHILHGDFACRNVLYQLAGGQILPKVSDFGGARKITGDKTYYSVRGKDIAFAWTAPEVFSSHHCDHQSDVFSFGVAMWEVYTNGAVPHAEKNLVTIPGFVIVPSNYPLLPKPTQCPNDAYDLINRCMALEPKHRPTFAQIVAQFSQMLANI